ncbi:hypothetical protein [Myxococcus xanthus]|uniref:Uncharacterized protein n=1 Tax=Myxococcus xanthus TaxID=34 RepID=A0A7Y4IJQ5_MYXXA|nr:hypothetical protein [Myxococcus xanthus]NOJ80497.1 hypothetical protein [Myxococcus xanthus]NOJ87513.1 hypothetical protein [Myxococcus xanthus]
MKKNSNQSVDVRPPSIRPGPARTSAASVPAPLTFPQAVLRPIPSQLELAQNEVTKVVELCDERARHFGTMLGISMSAFELNDPPNTTGQTDALALLVALTRSVESVSLERRDGRWGLWYTKSAPVLSSSQRPTTTVPLRDAPLEARMQFLRKSEEFFREYLKRTEEGLGSPQQAAEMGKSTLAMLDNIKSR